MRQISFRDKTKIIAGTIRKNYFYLNISYYRKGSLMKLIISFILIFCSNIFSQWVNQNPTQLYEDLVKIDFIDQNTGWIVGNYGIVLFTTDGGNNWVNRNISSENLKFVDFVDVNTGYVSSEENNLYRTTNGGLNWSLLNTGGYNPIISFCFINANSGIVAAGTNLIRTTNGGNNWNPILTGGSDRYFIYPFFLNSATGYVSSFNGEILKTTNFGNNWTSRNAPWGRLFFVNENTGWVYSGNSFESTLNKTTNGGGNWYVQNHPLTSLVSLDFIDPNTGYCTGYNNSMTTTNGGENWTIIPMYNNNRDVKVLNGSTAIIAGGRNAIVKTSNSGANWDNISKVVGTNISVKFFDANTGYISGENGVFARSTNGGNSFQKIRTGTLENLRLHFLNVNSGWLLTAKNKIMKTTSGGATWEVYDLNTPRNLFNMYFEDPNNGWIAGDSGMVMHTTNGGMNWSIKSTGVPFSIYKIVRFQNQNLAAITSDSLIMMSTNSGNSWFARSFLWQDSFTDICITGVNSAFAFSEYSIYKTTDAGINWTRISSDILLGPKYINYVGNTLYGITGSIVHKSINGGSNWSSSQIGNGYVMCYSISFINENTGWVAGENGSLFRNLNSSTIGIDPPQNELPENFVLHQNYPNPFNPATRIGYEVPKTGHVEISIYDITGKKVADLVNQVLVPGKYTADFDGSHLSSGVYFYRLQAGDKVLFRKMILLK